MKNFALLTLLCSLSTIASEFKTLKIENTSATTFTIWAPRNAFSHRVFEISPGTEQSLAISVSEITLVCLLQPNAFAKHIKLYSGDNNIRINQNLFVQHNNKEIHHFTPDSTQSSQ